MNLVAFGLSMFFGAAGVLAGYRLGFKHGWRDCDWQYDFHIDGRELCSACGARRDAHDRSLACHGFEECEPISSH